MIKRTSGDNFQRYIERRIESMKAALIRELNYIGEKCVNTARISARKGRDFKDQTGNLRGSIGYVIVVDGEIVSESAFEPVKDGAEGSQEGRNYAERLAKQHPQGIALVVVAGMNYAKYVASKGYDVLQSGELLAKKLVPQMLKELEA
ncbi:MAG: hypothetical protein IKN86_12355 [Bacteroidaceae bacterium]|nr:hypothetical protein [Bacteroidaceae bacterium]